MAGPVSHDAVPPVPVVPPVSAPVSPPGGTLPIAGTPAPPMSSADADKFTAAHNALKGNADIQFTFGPPPAPAPPPQWLTDFNEWLARVFKPVADFFHWLGQFIPDWPWPQILLWGVIALAAIAIVWAVVVRINEGGWRLPRRKRRRATAVGVEDEEEWTPDAGKTREWLREADALAAEGRYAEAIRHLLFRSIEDIEQRRPNLVRPALTSRELAAATAIPEGARTLFAGIVRPVENSLFGGRPVSQDDWQQARATYTDFVTPTLWAQAA